MSFRCMVQFLIGCHDQMLKIALRRCDAGLLEKLDDQWFSLLIFCMLLFAERCFAGLYCHSVAQC